MSQCRFSPHSPRHASLPLLRPEHAIDVITAAISLPLRAETVALLLDHRHVGGRILVVDGAISTGAVGDVVDCVVRLADDDPTIAALVLATVRPTATGGPTPDDELAFFDLRADADDGGVELIDWFVVSATHLWSVAARTDARWLWRG